MQAIVQLQSKKPQMLHYHKPVKTTHHKIQLLVKVTQVTYLKIAKQAWVTSQKTVWAVTHCQTQVIVQHQNKAHQINHFHKPVKSMHQLKAKAGQVNCHKTQLIVTVMLVTYQKTAWAVTHCQMQAIALHQNKMLQTHHYHKPVISMHQLKAKAGQVSYHKNQTQAKVQQVNTQQIVIATQVIYQKTA